VRSRCEQRPTDEERAIAEMPRNFAKRCAKRKRLSRQAWPKPIQFFKS
jgi:hypothetical protein